MKLSNKLWFTAVGLLAGAVSAHQIELVMAAIAAVVAGIIAEAATR